MAFERNSDEFVARRLHDALESAGLSAEAEEEFRARARRALTRQSRAFEEVIEAADRELVSRVTVSSTAREMMCAEYGEDFVEKYEEANENGIDMTLSIGPRGGKKLAAPIVGLFANTFGAAWKTVNFTLGSPFFIINRVGRTVFRQKRKHTAEQTVEEYREFMQPQGKGVWKKRKLVSQADLDGGDDDDVELASAPAMGIKRRREPTLEERRAASKARRLQKEQAGASSSADAGPSAGAVDDLD